MKKQVNTAPLKQFIIIETWNGEGYSDSTAGIESFQSVGEVKKYCFERAINSVDINSIGEVHSFLSNKNYTSYTICEGEEDKNGIYEYEDSGKYLFLEYTGQYAVVINPLLNESRVIYTKNEFEIVLNRFIKNAGDKEQKTDLQNKCFDRCYDSLEEGDVIIKILKK